MARSPRIRRRVDSTLTGVDALVAEFRDGFHVEGKVTGSFMEFFQSVLRGETADIPIRITIYPLEPDERVE